MAIGSTLIGLVFALFFGSMSSLAHAGITAFGGIFDGGNNDPTDGTADGLHVGTAAAPGMLTVDGGSQLHVMSPDLTVGLSNTGLVTLTGSSCATPSMLDVDRYIRVGGPTPAGAPGHRVLVVSGGAKVTSGTAVPAEEKGLEFLGVEQGSTGYVVVAGSCSEWTLDTGMAVGLRGTGTLTILDGGKVRAVGNDFIPVIGGVPQPPARPSLWIGLDGDASGTVTVRGGTLDLDRGDILLAAGPVNSSLTASGTLVIEAGGRVYSGGGFVALRTKSSGMVHVGLGSRWEISRAPAFDLGGGQLISGNVLSVGRRGNGALAVRDGGQILVSDPTYVNPALLIGRDGNATGVVTVSGMESSIEVTGKSPLLHVGRASFPPFGSGSGFGTLNVLDGGQVKLTSTDGGGVGRIGRDPGSVGRVTVAGANSLLSLPNLLALGEQGDGAPGGSGVLRVTSGGTVEVTPIPAPGACPANPEDPPPPGVGVLRIRTNDVLEGSGTIKACVHNQGGILTPGDSPGPMLILGSYTGGPGSQLVLEIDANGAHDSLQVRDGLTLDPASQILILIDPNLQVTPGQSFPLVQSDTGAALTVVGTPTGGFQVQSTPEFAPVTPEIRLEPVTTPILGTLTVAIDIKPGSFPNSINRGSAGAIPVAILSSATIDATQVDPATVTLAGAAVRLIGKGSREACSASDVNGDGRLDLVCHIAADELQLQEGDTVALLKGTTYSGAAIEGQDSVRIVP